MDAAGTGGVFFVSATNLPAGTCLLRCQILISAKTWSSDARLVIECAPRGGGAPVGRLEVPVADVLLAPDDLFLTVMIETPNAFEISGHVSENAAMTHIRSITGHAASDRSQVDYTYDYGDSHYAQWPVRKLRDVIVGTTGICNASCVHCPTNKTMLDHLDRKPMSMQLFKKIVDEIAKERIEIEGLFAFGLHGDALMDPLVVQRARYVRERLPGARILINTNGGPFNETKHAPLVDIVDCFSVHCEALTPEVFEQLMPPLRASNVFPKIERLAAISRGKISMCVPLSRKNVKEYRLLRDYWATRGITSVVPLAFSNRTTFELAFYDYSLAPTAGCCRQEVAFELVVDWDGQVLTCCQDFGKGNLIGDLRKQTLLETLESAARLEVFEKLGAGEWSKFNSCRNCIFDHPDQVNQIALASELPAA
jgi:radical SAM protein with 4Fe4S-binding SPASM domain